jgi:APA family basic amino acid/polyamine antiporter
MTSGENPAPKHSVSLFSLIALVVANMVGTGVFTSLGYQLAGLRSGFVLLALWVLGGICALCGALCYAELGTALCRSGGEYNFLTRIYARPVGFLAAWISATAGFAAPVALAAMALGSYMHRMYPSLDPPLVAQGVIAVITALHLLRPTIGETFQNTFTIAKVAIIALLIGIGLFHAPAAGMSFRAQPGDITLMTSSPFAISLVFVMFAYSGWNASTYVISEVKTPQRNIPRSLVLGTVLVTGLYLGLNWIFLRTTPAEKLIGQTEVGLVVANHILGSRYGAWMGMGIALLLVSSISSMVRVGPRVAQTVGQDYPLFGLFSATSRYGIPHWAVLFQGLLSVLLVATGTFERVLVYAQFSLLLCTFLAALGVLILRFTQPDLPRPYRTWGYPITPLVFLGITAWMMAYVIKDKPRESLMGLGTILTGLLAYTLSSRFAALAPNQEVNPS